MNNKKLKAEGTYSDSPYGNHIDGYRESDDLGGPAKDSGKAMFLKDAAAILRQVGSHLAESGLGKKEITINRAGIGVSGEVWGEYWSEKDPCRRIWIEIGTSCVDMLSGRRDSVCIMARTKQLPPPEEKRQSPRTGANQFLSPAYDSLELARQLLDIFEHNYGKVRVINKTDGAMVMPEMIVKSQEEGDAAMRTCLAVEASMRQDAQAHLETPVDNGQLTLIAQP